MYNQTLIIRAKKHYIRLLKLIKGWQINNIIIIYAFNPERIMIKKRPFALEWP